MKTERDNCLTVILNYMNINIAATFCGCRRLYYFFRENHEKYNFCFIYKLYVLNVNNFEKSEITDIYSCNNP